MDTICQIFTVQHYPGATAVLLLPAALHGENLHEADAIDGRQNSEGVDGIRTQDIQDVDHIEFESDRLPDRVPCDSTCLGHTSVIQDFLSAGELVMNQSRSVSSRGDGTYS